MYIYLREPFVKQIKREEKTSYVTLIGTIGGLLGLFMGFSVISVIEIFYMMFLWLISKLNMGHSKIQDTAMISKKHINSKVTRYLDSIVNSKNQIKHWEIILNKLLNIIKYVLRLFPLGCGIFVAWLLT